MKHSTVAALVTSALVAAAGTAHADAQLWTELGVRHDFDKQWTATFDQHVRFDADVSRVGAVMPEIGLSYQVARRLRTGVGYRLEYERDNGGAMQARHRFFAWGRLRSDVGRVRLQYRLQLQEQIRGDANPVYRHTVRNRGDLILRKLGPVEPGVSLETHHILGEDGNAIHLGKVWLTAGAEHRRGDVTFDLFYRLITGQHDPAEPNGHVLGLGLHYAF